MDIKSFLIGILCSVLVVVLFVAWSDVGAAPAAATHGHGRYQLTSPSVDRHWLLDHKTGALWTLHVSTKKWVKLNSGPQQ
jgi:hypothetical protein